MDLDNITDIEVLRTELKKNMVKAKKDFYSNGTHYLFRKDNWYNVEQSDDDIMIFSDDGKSYCIFSYEEADEYLYKV